MILLKLLIGFQLTILICGKTPPWNIILKQAAQEFIPQIPGECLPAEMCEQVPNYPEEYVAGVLKRLMKKTNYINDTINKAQLEEKLSFPEDEGAEFELCESERKEVIPQAARSVDGNWYFILNQGEFVQKFFSVNCKYRSNKRDMGCASYLYFQGAYPTGRCLQKKSKVKLMAVDHFGLVEKKTFELNSCCSCVAAHKLVIN